MSHRSEVETFTLCARANMPPITASDSWRRLKTRCRATSPGSTCCAACGARFRRCRAPR